MEKSDPSLWRVAPSDPTCVFPPGVVKPIRCHSQERAAAIVAAMNATLCGEEITLEDVLGSLLSRIRSRDSRLPPRILCMSTELREENRTLARQVVAQVRREEQIASEQRAQGNPHAFFAQR